MKPRLWMREGLWCCGVKLGDGKATWFESATIEGAYYVWDQFSYYALRPGSGFSHSPSRILPAQEDNQDQTRRE